MILTLTIATLNSFLSQILSVQHLLALKSLEAIPFRDIITVKVSRTTHKSKQSVTFRIKIAWNYS